MIVNTLMDINTCVDTLEFTARFNPKQLENIMKQIHIITTYRVYFIRNNQPPKLVYHSKRGNELPYRHKLLPFIADVKWISTYTKTIFD